MYGFLIPASEEVRSTLNTIDGVSIIYQSKVSNIVGVESSENIYQMLCDLVGGENVLIDEPNGRLLR